jgi:polyisoprenoid-binding protein YceI
LKKGDIRLVVSLFYVPGTGHSQYEYITFGPTAIEGVPDSVAVGETVSFTIVGDLTIRDITRPATFDVTATLLSDSELSGTASTAVLLEDYNLNIPNLIDMLRVLGHNPGITRLQDYLF